MTQKISDQITIKELGNLDEMMSAHSLVSQMYEIDYATYRQYISEMIERNNFKMVAVFLDEKIIGISGYWISVMLYCGRYLQASNLIVDSESRNLGVGKKILNYLEEKAKEFACNKMVLDSYTENKKSHALFYRQGFYIRGFHFMKNLD